MREPTGGTQRPPCETPRRLCLSPLRGLRPTVRNSVMLSLSLRITPRGCRPFSAKNSPPDCFPGAPNPTGPPPRFASGRNSQWSHSIAAAHCASLLIGPPHRFRFRRMPHRGTAQLRSPATYTSLPRIIIRGRTPPDNPHSQLSGSLFFNSCLGPVPCRGHRPLISPVLSHVDFS